MSYVLFDVLYAVVGTVSGTTVSFGTAFTASAATTSYNALVTVGNTVFAVYNRAGLKARMLTISGTTITGGTEVALSGSTSAAHISATLLPDSRVCVCYADAGDSNKGKAVIATVSGTAVTWGSPATFSGSVTTYIDCCTDGGDVIVSFVASNIAYAKVMPIDGTTISANAVSLSIGSASDSTQIEKIGNQIVITHSGGQGVAVALTRNENNLSKGLSFVFNAVSANYLTIVAIDSSRFIAAYADSGNSNYGTATILTVFGDRIAGSFTDTSKDAIALDSGTSGDPVSVIYSGVTAVPGLTKGQEIKSAGVSGFAPLDGVLSVVPWWGKDVATGSYIGTGTNGATSPSSITFPFFAQAVLIYPISQSGISANGSPCPVVMQRGETSIDIYSYDGNTGASIVERWDGATLFWYSVTGPKSQLNATGCVYKWIAYR